MINSIEPGKYKNLIFDLGGVLINIDYNKTLNAFKSLCIRNIEELYTQQAQVDIFDKFDRGETGWESFRDELIRKTQIRANESDFKNAWNAMLLDFPPERLDLLEKLRKTHRLFLLSNTNAVHIEGFYEKLKKAGLYQRFINVFEKHFYSFELGMRKPEKRIFDYVLNSCGLNPEQTLFLDDSPQHVEGARQAGLHAVHVGPETDIIRLFGKFPEKE